MGQKLYQETQEGSIKFISHRKGEVRIPNYVYDLWLPLIGATAIGVYSVYCRLERENVVKAMSKRRIAKLCRIGTKRLDAINDMLEDCGFITITEPTGFERLMHWTTEIAVYDAPDVVSKTLIEKYQQPSGYEILSPWLQKDEIETPTDASETPNNVSVNTKQCIDNAPNNASNVVSLGLNSLEVELRSNLNADSSESGTDVPPIDKSLLDSRGIMVYEFVDNEYTEFTCCCGSTLDVRTLPKRKCKCPVCDTPIQIHDSHGNITHKPFYAAKPKRVLGDIIPDCPEKLADIPYQTNEQASKIKIMLAQNKGLLLSSLNWAANMYVSSGWGWRQLVDNGITAAANKIGIAQKPDVVEQQPQPQPSPTPKKVMVRIIPNDYDRAMAKVFDGK